MIPDACRNQGVGHRRNIVKIAASAVLTARANPVLDLQNTVIWLGHVFSSSLGFDGPDCGVCSASIRDDFQGRYILFQQRVNRKPRVGSGSLENRLLLAAIHQQDQQL